MGMANKGADGNKVVLIVDDELDMRTFLSTLVKISGYDAVLANDGEEGFRKAVEVRPDLLILDVLMPGEGGLHMYYQLKTNAELKRTPVIILSAIAKNTFYHYLNVLNFKLDESTSLPESYIEKPPDAEKLMKLIKKILHVK
jgi:two-component system phosphate regulon response regulator PhoB